VAPPLRDLPRPEHTKASPRLVRGDAPVLRRPALVLPPGTIGGHPLVAALLSAGAAAVWASDDRRACGS
jgi:hypothetical protein